MSVEFKTMAEKLWASLALPPPVFRADDEIVLNIDGTNIKLAESPDGRHMLVSGTAGQLSADPSRRADQVRTILYTNLGALTSNRACAALDPKGVAAAEVIVQAVHPYDHAAVDQLMVAVQDVVAFVEGIANVLKDQHGRSMGRAHAAHESAHQDALVFRP
jgi:hypothetical protein